MSVTFSVVLFWGVYGNFLHIAGAYPYRHIILIGCRAEIRDRLAGGPVQLVIGPGSGAGIIRHGQLVAIVVIGVADDAVSFFGGYLPAMDIISIDCGEALLIRYDGRLTVRVIV